MFVTTATSRASFRKERSDSSASTTAHSPAPQPAFGPAGELPADRGSPGRGRSRRSAWAAIDAVVVLPCVPARRSCASSATARPAGRHGAARAAPRARAALAQGCPRGSPSRRRARAPGGTLAGVVADRRARSRPRAGARSRGSRRGREPVTSAPSRARRAPARSSGAADADEVEAPPSKVIRGRARAARRRSCGRRRRRRAPSFVVLSLSL